MTMPPLPWRVGRLAVQWARAEDGLSVSRS